VAAEIWHFAFTIPPGTTKAAPLTVDLTMPPRNIVEVEIKIPAGPAGMMGFQLAAAGQSMIPVNAGQWIVTDNEAINWPMHDQIESGAWQAIGYNTGTYPHTIYIRFQVDLIGVAPSAPAANFIPSSALTPIPDATAIASLNGLTQDSISDPGIDTSSDVPVDSGVQ
jgi:hypothetical protein